MKKVMLLCVLIVVISCQFVFASSSDNWEYMVVSFGKTYFSDLRSKTMAYWDQGISKSVKGADSIEKDLDILGVHGWEVVSILGTIGGDQQVTFKRPLDASRTSTELQTIDANSEKVVNGYLESLIAEDKKRKEASPSIEIKLVELDAYEAEQAKLKARADVEAAATIFFNSLTKKPLDISYSWDTDASSKKDEVRIHLKFDVTKECLINSNQYRKSEVLKVLGLEVETIRNVPISKETLGSVSMDGYITYMNKEFNVGHVYHYIDYRGKWTSF